MVNGLWRGLHILFYCGLGDTALRQAEEEIVSGVSVGQGQDAGVLTGESFAKAKIVLYRLMMITVYFPHHVNLSSWLETLAYPVL